MFIIKNEVHKIEEAIFNFKSYCDDCRYYCSKRDLCAMIYPTSLHKKNAYLKAKDGERIYFCKMFEVK